MSRFTSAAALFATFSASAALAAPYGTAGCGLGSLVFNDDRGIVQIFAATTNGTFGTQTFGITSGTSNCVDSGGMAAIDQKAFMKVNYASVKRNAASGGGEFMTAMSVLLGCEAPVHDNVAALSQRRHSEIFATESSDEALDNLKRAVRADPTLAGQCARI